MSRPSRPNPHDLALLEPLLEPRHLALAAEVDAFVRDVLEPLPHAGDDGAARAQARQLVELLGQARLVRFALPAACGGVDNGPDLRACALIREALAAASPLADSVFALQCLGSQPLVLGASEPARGRWLPEVLAGRAMAAFAMTEPEAGSDVGGLQTLARRDGDGWRLDGRKWLITNAGEADFYCVFAQCDPALGTRGIGCFLVEAANPGLRFPQAQVLSEPHPLGELVFESCRVEADAVLAPPAEGFKLGMRTLDRLRPTVAAAACGFSARALAEAVAHAKSRRQFGKTLAEQQMTQHKVARMATELAAARLLTWRAAYAADRAAAAGEPVRITLQAAMAKSYATEAAQRIVDDAVQIIGGRACLQNHPVDRLYRAVRALRIYEGATEIQHLVIARHVLADPS
jgi:acyl-CoA dehydrogenase